MSRTLIRSLNPSLSGSKFFNTFSVCEFERACNSNEGATEESEFFYFDVNWNLLIFLLLIKKKC
jgi:hypothetical protein